MDPPVQLVRSLDRDPHRNLALEEHLFETLAPGRAVLFLCVNAPCVVIGKNQNPWMECDTALLRRRGIPLARRMSGGGAVYHDGGNLNYSVMMPRAAYRAERVFETVMAAVRSLGVEPRMQGRTSIAVAGRKISGNAFCLRGDRALHHGTLLVAADLRGMSGALRPALPGIETKAVRSVPAEVANLAELVSGLRLDDVAAGLVHAFGARIGAAAAGADHPASDGASHLERQRSWAWIYGHTPAFEADVVAGLRVRVEKGFVVRADAMEAGTAVDAVEPPAPVPFGAAELAEALSARAADGRWAGIIRALSQAAF